MKVLLVMGEATGGISGHVLSLGRGLAGHGVQVVIATTAASARHLVGAEPGDGIDLSSAASGSQGSLRVEVLWPGRGGSLARLRRAVAGADIVHAHGHQAGALSVLLARTVASRPPVVVTWHNALLAGGPQAAVGALLERLQAHGAQLVTGASSDLVERALQVGAPASELSNVAADLRPWPGDPVLARADLATELGLDPAAAWVLTVSRIAPQKNLPVLVSAAATLGQADRSGSGAGRIEWIVVGSGDAALETRLRDQIATSDAPVRLVGSRRDVPRLIAAADVLALPSLWEARSLVVQEALVGALPCVVSDTGDCRNWWETPGSSCRWAMRMHWQRLSDGSWPTRRWPRSFRSGHWRGVPPCRTPMPSRASG